MPSHRGLPSLGKLLNQKAEYDFRNGDQLPEPRDSAIQRLLEFLGDKDPMVVIGLRPHIILLWIVAFGQYRLKIESLIEDYRQYLDKGAIAWRSKNTLWGLTTPAIVPWKGCGFLSSRPW